MQRLQTKLSSKYYRDHATCPYDAISITENETTGFEECVVVSSLSLSRGLSAPLCLAQKMCNPFARSAGIFNLNSERWNFNFLTPNFKFPNAEILFPDAEI